MKNIFYAFAGILLLFAFSMQSTEAYLSTEQNAFTVDGKTGIFTITFEFGHSNYDVYIPIIARRDASSESSITYSIQNDEGEPTPGTSVALVLSKARIENGMYKIPKGTKAAFTLLATYTRMEEEIDANYSARVTHLPFSFDRTRTLELNPSELKYYVTPEIGLHDGPHALVTNITVVTSTEE